MATEQSNQEFYDRVAGLREELVRRVGADLIANPQLAEALVKKQAAFFPVDALPEMGPRHLEAIRIARAGEPGVRLGPGG